MMYKLLSLILATILLASCGSVSSETHEIYTDIPDISIALDTRGVSNAAEDQPLFIEISEDGEPIDTAEISLEVWRAAEDVSTRKVYPVSRRDDGIYEASVDIDAAGLYLAKADISTGDVKATPVQYFTVGHLSPEEHALLGELVPGEEAHTGGHH